MTILRVILDEMTRPGNVGRYTRELSRELIRSAPRGCYVEGFVAASTETEYSRILDELPGLEKLHKSTLAARELRSAWQHGFTRLPGRGMVHAPTPLAPLSRHDRLNEGDEISVTFHDALAWTRPDSLPARTVAWYRAMAKRAERHADAIVVPSHTVADQLAEVLNFGDRVRVINGAPSSSLALPLDAAERAARLNLPSRFVLAAGGLESRAGLDRLVLAMKNVDPAVPLVYIGTSDNDATLRNLVADAGLAPERILSLGQLDDSDLAAVVSRATVFVYPHDEEGFGLPILEAFALGGPVVHSDSAALVEIAADAGLAVELDPEVGYPRRLAEAINAVLADSTLAERLRQSGLDRARLYTWRSAAEKVWQLHADL